MQKKENNAFYCENCQQKVEALTNGSYRNHCPYCLYSKHVDMFPGDRASTCLGLMEPVDLKKHSKKGYQVLHQCQTCKQLQWNKLAFDTVQEDDLFFLIKYLQL